LKRRAYGVKNFTHTKRPQVSDWSSRSSQPVVGVIMDGGCGRHDGRLP
jgi:hypothetical protein